jgi:transcriptional regulator with XRE-family HTH domain
MTDDIKLIIKENLRFYRNHHQISQQTLAERCGVSTTYIGEIEIGRKVPSLKTLTKLATALQVEPYRLLMPHGYHGSTSLDHFADEVRESIERLVTEVRNRY